MKTSHTLADLVKNVKLKVIGTAVSKSFEVQKILKNWKFRVQNIPQTAPVVTVLSARAAEKFALPAAAGEKGSMWGPDSNIAVSQLRFFPFLRSCLLYMIAAFSKHDALKRPSELWLSRGNLQFPRAKLLFSFLLSEN